MQSKLVYYNSLLLNLPSTQTKRLQLVPNAAAPAVTKTPKFDQFLLLYLFTGRNFLEWQNVISEHLSVLEAKRESGVAVTN
jgi:hypothetical protein